MLRQKKQASGDPSGKSCTRAANKKKEKTAAKSNDSSDPVKQYTSIVASHTVICDTILFVIQQERYTQHDWTFTIKPKPDARNLLKEISLVTPDLPEFWISAVVINSRRYEPSRECQHFIIRSEVQQCNTLCKVVVSFYSENYGSFDQRIAFDFGEEKNVERCIGINVCDEADLLNTLSYQPPSTNEDELSWMKNYSVVPFDPTEKAGKEEAAYRLPPNIENCVKWDAFDNLSKIVTKEKYTFRQHLLLHLEEHDRRKELQKLSFQLDNIQDYVDASIPGVTTHRTLKVPLDYCTIQLISRLIGRSGKALAKVGFESKELVYELRMLSFSTDFVFFELNPVLDELLSLHLGGHSATICFRFVDNFKFMHRAIDKINLDVIFPDHNIDIPSSWRADVRKGLNTIQSRAVFHVSDESPRPPLLVLGPFGSGKTKTMAESIMVLLDQMAYDYKNKGATDRKILLCTHSNSAADHYINDYIHGFLEDKKSDKRLRPLRINWEYRYSAAMSNTVLSYSLVDQTSGNFRRPSKEDVDNHSIIITTLVTAAVLWDIGIKPGYFSHIIIDEAAQAMEPETIIPLTLATPQTRIVLAGDHLQLSPPVISTLAREKLGLGTSLLGRMFLSYPADSQARMKFVENFRSWEDIVDLASHIFYSDSLISHFKRPSTISFPIHFHGIRGKEEISQVTPSYLNSSEAAEILNIVRNIKSTWDSSIIGNFVDENICVLASYLAQIQAIRNLLRKYGLGKVRVDTIQNVQGLEFDVVIISCVRTYIERTILDDKEGEELGYLSNPKMLNTAITRAKYFCYFVGDPVALCKIGACKPCWKIILARCEEHNTFYYRLGFKRLMQLLDQEAEDSRQGTQGNVSHASDKTEEYDFESPISAVALYGDPTEDIVPPMSRLTVQGEPGNRAPKGRENMKDHVFAASTSEVQSSIDTPCTNLEYYTGQVVSRESRPTLLEKPLGYEGSMLPIVSAEPNAGKDALGGQQVSETLSKADCVTGNETSSPIAEATSNQGETFGEDSIRSRLSAYQRYLSKYFEITLQASSTYSEQLNWKEKFTDLKNLLSKSFKTQSDLEGVIDESFDRIIDELDSKVLVNPPSDIVFYTKPSELHRGIATRMDELEKERYKVDAAMQLFLKGKVKRNHVMAEIWENLQGLSAYVTLCENLLHESQKLISRLNENSKAHQVLSLRLWMCNQNESDISQQIRGVNERIRVTSELNPQSKDSDFFSIPFQRQAVPGSRAPVIEGTAVPGSRGPVIEGKAALSLFAASDMKSLHGEHSRNMPTGTSPSAVHTMQFSNAYTVQGHMSGARVRGGIPGVVPGLPANNVGPIIPSPLSRFETVPMQHAGNHSHTPAYPHWPAFHGQPMIPSTQLPYQNQSSTVAQSVRCTNAQFASQSPVGFVSQFPAKNMQPSKSSRDHRISLLPRHRSSRSVQATQTTALHENNSLRGIESGETVEGDAEVQAWFKDTGTDQFAQEYVLDSDRAKAAKLPSPKLFP